MLLNFKFSNFCSFYAEQSLELVATKYVGHKESLLKSAKVESGVIPAIAIYGANAAGKTNVLKALHFFANAIARSQDRWPIDGPVPVQPHFFHEDEPTTFEASFQLGREVYTLSFTCDRQQILTESLFSGRKSLYTRKGQTIRLGEALKGFESFRRNTRKNALFISVAAQNNHPLLSRMHSWFSHWRTVTDDRTKEEAMTGHLLAQEYMKDFLIQGMKVINPDVTAIVPGEEDKELPINFDSLNEGTVTLLRHFSKWTNVQLVHQSPDGKSYAISLREESKGTRSYLAMASTILYTLSAGSVFLLDEANQSMHPSLIRSLVSLFHNKSTNPYGAQLIFNAHDTTLLTPDLLRPDEVWFVSRAEDLTSSLYSLADFEGIRSDTKSQRAYLEGRFGAVPFLEEHADIFSSAVQVLKVKK